MGARIDGVDISHWQAGPLDMAAAKRAGVRWLFHKATEGKSWKDSRHDGRRAEAKAAGLLWGAYHFARNGNPTEQANWFLKVANPQPGDMRPMLDFEAKEDFESWSPARRTRWVGEFVAVVKKATGVAPFVYTPFDLTEHFDCPLWVARYSDEMKAPRIPKPWTEWTVWQFSNGRWGDPNRVDGLGHVDLNTMNGDPAALTETFRIPQQAASTDRMDPKAYFVGAKGPHVTWLGERLVRHGFDPYVSGPGPTFTSVDRRAVQWFQTAQGWTGPETDGLPGKKTLEILSKPPEALFRVGFANVQNFPDLSDDAQLADVKEMLDVSDVVMFCEIGEPSDFAALGEAGGDDWYFVRTKKEVVVGWRNDLFVQVEAPSMLEMSPSLGPNMMSPTRWLMCARIAWRKAPALKWEVQSGHYVQNAWDNKPVPKKEQRKKNWILNWERQKAQILSASRKGYVVLFGVDFNRTVVPLFFAAQQWLTNGRRIDKIGVLSRPGVTVLTGRIHPVDLNSDHPGLWGWMRTTGS